MVKENLKTIEFKPSEMAKLNKFLKGKTWLYAATLLGIERVTLYNAVSKKRTGNETYKTIFHALFSKT